MQHIDLGSQVFTHSLKRFCKHREILVIQDFQEYVSSPASNVPYLRYISLLPHLHTFRAVFSKIAIVFSFLGFIQSRYTANIRTLGGFIKPYSASDTTFQSAKRW